MLADFERGKLSRRQLALSLAALATGAQAAPKATGLRAVSINHISVRVPDIQRTSKFYQEFFGMPLKEKSAAIHILGVGDSFFGVEQGVEPADRKTARLDHFDFGIANFNAGEARAKLKARNLKPDSDSEESFKFRDPDGFLVQLNATNYVGHAS